MENTVLNLRTCLYKDGTDWIAETIDYSFIAQGYSIDQAINGLVACVVSQYFRDKSKGKVELESQKKLNKAFQSIFENADIRYKAEIQNQESTLKIQPELVYV